MSTTDQQQLNTTPQPSPQPAAPAPEPDTIPVSRAEYDAMQEQLAQARATFEVLNPHAARLEKLVKEPRYAEIFDDAITAYENIRTRSQPQVPDEIRPVYEKVSKLETFVDKYEAREKEAQERPAREYQQRYNEWQNAPSNNRFFQRLMSDHPELKPRDIQYLAQVAAEDNFEPLEAVWKKESWRFERQATSAPPTSQRADAGEVGSAPSSNGSQGPSMRERIIELERARRGMTA